MEEGTNAVARDYDSQLLESVGVRRVRLRDAVLFGAQRTRRTLDEGLGKVFGGVALAAVLCAGCVGWSFVSDRLQQEGGLFGLTPTHQAQQAQQAQLFEQAQRAHLEGR